MICFSIQIYKKLANYKTDSVYNMSGGSHYLDTDALRSVSPIIKQKLDKPV